MRGTFKKIYILWARWIAVLSVGALAIAMLFDISSSSYWTEWLEEFFKGKGDLTSIILVIWTFTASLIVFCIERCNERYYGIRLLDILFSRFKKNQLLCMMVVFLGELFVLIIAETKEWKITLVTSAIVQFFSMVFALLMVCMDMSGYAVVDILDRDISNKDNEGYTTKKRLLSKIIRNLDYSSMDETDFLCARLKKWNILDFSAGNVRKEIEEIVRNIVEAGREEKSVCNILKNWFIDENTTLQVQQGILKPLIEDSALWSMETCNMLLDIKQKHSREIYIWCITLHALLEEYGEQKWRKVYWERLRKRLHSWTEEDKKNMLSYWVELHKEYHENIEGSVKNTAEILKIIFEYRWEEHERCTDINFV